MGEVGGGDEVVLFYFVRELARWDYVLLEVVLGAGGVGLRD